MFTGSTSSSQKVEKRRITTLALDGPARQVRSNVKVLLTVFFDYHDVVHQEFLPQGRTVNKEYYLEVMRRLREAIRKKRPEL